MAPGVLFLRIAGCRTVHTFLPVIYPHDVPLGDTGARVPGRRTGLASVVACRWFGGPTLGRYGPTFMGVSAVPLED